MIKKLEEEVGEKGLKLSVTENGKEGKSKIMADVGSKWKSEKKKCKVRFSIIKKSEAFQKNYMKVEFKKLYVQA